MTLRHSAYQQALKLMFTLPPERIHAVVLAPPGVAAPPPFTVHTGDGSDPGTLARMMAMRLNNQSPSRSAYRTCPPRLTSRVICPPPSW